MKVTKLNYKSGEDFGTIGDFAFDNGFETVYHIGDIVTYKSKSTINCQVGNAIVCNMRGSNTLMGWGHSPENINDANFEIVEKVIPYTLLTQEILDYIHKGFLKIIEEEVKELTLDEVREYVPFKFVLKES